MSLPRLALTALLSLILPAAMAGPALAAKDHGPSKAEPLVIAHRGASGYRPEHTLAAYALGARMGADYIEPDLVSTKDGVLVARHENEISGTTDVADHAEFVSRRATKVIDGVSMTGWFTEDFTLAELKTLRAKERIPALRPRNTLYDGRYEVPTLQEVIHLVRRLSRELGRRIGIYPETKHPTYFRRIGLPLEEPLVRILRRNDLDGRRAKVFVQSFEVSNLQALDRRIDVPLVQLLSGRSGRPYDFVVSRDPRTYADLATPAGLKEIAKYADGVGPSKDYIVPRDAAGASLPPTTFVRDAHRAGLAVHPYTFRNENSFLPLELRLSADPAAYGKAFAEYEQFYGLGVDGLFSDNPDTAVEARG
jgi:glycerophosphoryl diester phosphodiesterase